MAPQFMPRGGNKNLKTEDNCQLMAIQISFREFLGRCCQSSKFTSKFKFKMQKKDYQDKAPRLTQYQSRVVIWNLWSDTQTTFTF